MKLILYKTYSVIDQETLLRKEFNTKEDALNWLGWANEHLSIKDFRNDTQED